jgi:hypothetical protein
MAIFGGSFLTYPAKGQREKLANAIYEVSPEDTPLVSLVSKIDAEAVLQEWQTYELADVDTDNAHLEGDHITSVDSLSPTTRLGNRMQISRKLLSISGTLLAVDSAGQANSLGRHVTRKGVELRRDLEAIIFSNQGARAGSATVARKTAALLAFIKTNVNKAADGIDPTYTDGVPTGTLGRVDGTPRAFTETILKDVLLQAWTSGAMVDGKFLFMHAVQKQVFSGFDGVASQTYNLSGRKPGQTTIVAAADVYVSDFGAVTAVLSRWQRTTDVFHIDPDFIGIYHLRPFMVKTLPVPGDADVRMILQEWGLQVKNEAGLALAADLSTP